MQLSRDEKTWRNGDETKLVTRNSTNDGSCLCVFDLNAIVLILRQKMIYDKSFSQSPPWPRSMLPPLQGVLP